MKNAKYLNSLYDRLTELNDSIAKMDDGSEREEAKRDMFDIRNEINKIEESE